MQFSSTKLSSSIYTADTSVRQTSQCPTIAIAVIGLSCLACTFGLVFAAFTIVPDNDAGIDCVTSNDSGASELYKTLLLFALGYVSSLAAKRRHNFGANIDQIICTMNRKVSSAAARVASFATRARSFQQPSWVNKDVLAILVTSSLCSICVIWLLVSAFTAEPDSEPTDDGLASESSAGMRVFTVGWMFILTFKLRRELVGVIGSCCLLQPW